ncbi:MAG: hypothetical protein M1816_003515 [Peltula sp. TS41687]|nr:MAG: hypothetical protein M1816_003515 [Peltula sp. TS41687]
MVDLMQYLITRPLPTTTQSQSQSRSQSHYTMDEDTSDQPFQSIHGLTLLDTGALTRSILGVTRVNGSMDTMEQQLQLHHQEDIKPDMSVSNPDVTGVGEYLSRLDVQNVLQQNRGGPLPSHGQAAPSSSMGSSPQITATRDPQAIAKLHELCQSRSLPQPRFEFEEVALQLFAARLEISGYVDISPPTPFPSKKAAKEAVAAQGLEMLQNTPAVAVNNQPQQPEINWVGKLLGRIDSTIPDLPIYTVHYISLIFVEWGQNSTRNTHTPPAPVGKKPASARITAVNVPGVPFGDNAHFFKSKKAAKNNAAKEAYLWLKQQGFVR